MAVAGSDTLQGGTATVTVGGTIVTVDTTSQQVFETLQSLSNLISNQVGNAIQLASFNTSTITSGGTIDLATSASFTAANNDDVVVLSGSIAPNATINLPNAFNGVLVIDADPVAGTVAAHDPIHITGVGGSYKIIVGDTPVNVNITKTDPNSVITIVTGNGNNLLDPGVGDYTYISAAGDDTVYQHGGTAHAALGGGHNVHIYGGGANAEVTVTGQDTVFASSGTHTISVGSTGSAMVWGGNSTIGFVGGSNASTVLGGFGNTTGTGLGGSDTMFGGDGGGLFTGGFAGNNNLMGGTGAVTLVGGGGNDTLFASWRVNTATNYIQAGWGNTTLNAGTATGGNIYGTGLGNSTVQGGSGNDTFWVQSGNSTMAGGAGNDTFIFTKGADGGNYVIGDFVFGADTILLKGFTMADVTASTVVGGSKLTLSDGSRITFNAISTFDTSKINFG